jgi:hypothetical protein
MSKGTLRLPSKPVACSKHATRLNRITGRFGRESSAMGGSRSASQGGDQQGETACPIASSVVVNSSL